MLADDDEMFREPLSKEMENVSVVLCEGGKWGVGGGVRAANPFRA